MLENLDRCLKEDALWRPIPRKVWGMVLTEVVGRIGEMIPGGPCRRTPSWFELRNG